MASENDGVMELEEVFFGVSAFLQRKLVKICMMHDVVDAISAYFAYYCAQNDLNRMASALRVMINISYTTEGSNALAAAGLPVMICENIVNGNWECKTIMRALDVLLHFALSPGQQLLDAAENGVIDMLSAFLHELNLLSS